MQLNLRCLGPSWPDLSPSWNRFLGRRGTNPETPKSRCIWFFNTNTSDRKGKCARRPLTYEKTHGIGVPGDSPTTSNRKEKNISQMGFRERMELKLQMEFIQSIRDGLDTGRQVLRRACYLQDQPCTCMCGREMHLISSRLRLCTMPLIV